MEYFISPSNNELELVEYIAQFWPYGLGISRLSHRIDA